MCVTIKQSTYIFHCDLSSFFFKPKLPKVILLVNVDCFPWNCMLLNAAGIPWFVAALTLIARAADACAGSSTVVLTSELNPTSVRQLAMGILLACNGFGGVIAPFLNQFLVRNFFVGMVFLHRNLCSCWRFV